MKCCWPWTQIMIDTGEHPGKASGSFQSWPFRLVHLSEDKVWQSLSSDMRCWSLQHFVYCDLLCTCLLIKNILIEYNAIMWCIIVVLYILGIHLCFSLCLDFITSLDAAHRCMRRRLFHLFGGTRVRRCCAPSPMHACLSPGGMWLFLMMPFFHSFLLLPPDWDASCFWYSLINLASLLLLLSLIITWEWVTVYRQVVAVPSCVPGL